MIGFLRTLPPRYTSPHIKAQGDLLVLRERIMQTILLSGAVLGILTLIIVWVSGIATRQWAIVYPLGGIVFSFLVLAALRRLPFGARANPLIIIVYLGGVWILVRSGLGGGLGGIFLFASTALAAVLSSGRVILASVIVNMVTLIVVGGGMSYGYIVIPPFTDFMGNSSSLKNWIIYIASFFVVIVIAGTGQIVLSNGVNSILHRLSDLANDLQMERQGLEKRIQDRTTDLQRRLVQIRTAAAISSSISSVLETQTLLQQVADLIHDQLNLYYVGVFMLDENGQFAVLKSGTGEAGKNMITAGHRLPVGGTSMIGQATVTRQPRIALDVGSESVRFNNPNLPLTRSELALPIIGRDNVLGAFTIQSSEPHAFDEDDVLILKGIADSLATAIENANLFRQSQENLEEIRSLNRAFLQQEWSEAISNLGNLAYTYESSLPENTGGTGRQTEIPIMLRGQEIGHLVIETETGVLSSEENSFVDAVVTQTALALESARLLGETQRRAQQEQKVNQVSASFSRSMNIEDILKSAVRELGQMPSVSEVSIKLVPPKESALINPRDNNGKNQEKSR
jgi:GAF domain-containing protein